ncbi:hypothetical protein O1611_g8963 [Lasiodiplodia mahajangana]|uniref:Uncharacterized protein n=1 Tax=Lasiodiplodia mahajangana TaxID=1108764 RepID=A0ACC2JBL6_9PEZI|nr:hypothetical protein O1611_g8963 [Lasiodiplodia mahajangana]
MSLTRAPSTVLEDVKLDMMVGDYVGKAIQGQVRRSQFRIEAPCWYDEQLAVAPAFSNGELFEAQFFGNGILPRKLYLSRKRRIQRLRKSKNFEDMSDQGGVKVFFSRVPKEKGLQEYRKCMETGAKPAPQYTYSVEDFPTLSSNHTSSIPNTQRNAKPASAKAYSSFANAASRRSS